MTLYGVLQWSVSPVVRAFGRLEVDGAGGVPAGPVVVVANHDSLADPFFLGAALDRPLRFLTKSELWRYRLVGRLLDELGGIPVERARGDLTAVAAAGRALTEGAAVVVFPQGTVLGPADRPWQRGAARLALTTGAPLLPVAIVGAANVLRPRTPVPRPAPARRSTRSPGIERAQSALSGPPPLPCLARARSSHRRALPATRAVRRRGEGQIRPASRPAPERPAATVRRECPAIASTASAPRMGR